MIPETLLGSASPDALVPFHPRHWAELRQRTQDATAAAGVDDALAVALDMSLLVRTVLIGCRPECVMGLYLTPAPDVAAPWVLIVNPTIERLGPAIRVSRRFLEECFSIRPVLRTELQRHEEATFCWLAGLGFRQVGTPGPVECWELTGR